MVSIRSPTLTVASSSSRISLTTACCGVSPVSIFPPGNSHPVETLYFVLNVRNYTTFSACWGINPIKWQNLFRKFFIYGLSPAFTLKLVILISVSYVCGIGYLCYSHTYILVINFFPASANGFLNV